MTKGRSYYPPSRGNSTSRSFLCEIKLFAPEVQNSKFYMGPMFRYERLAGRFLNSTRLVWSALDLAIQQQM